MAYDDIELRPDVAAELPVQLADELILGTIRETTALKLGNRVPTTTRDSRIPVLATKPKANWITTQDVGLGQTAKAVITNEVLVAEELMAIVPVPNAVLEDSQYPVWTAIKPLMTQSMAEAVDDAVLWGVNKPSTFPNAVGPAAIAAGNTVTGDVFATATDNAGLVMQAATMVSQQGFPKIAAAVAPGWQYRVGAQRTSALVANPAGADQPFPLLLGGMPISVDPLRWAAAGASSIDAIVGQWSNLILGMRRDITIQPFDSGVITDASGAIQINLLQSDMTAIRVTMRVGFYVAVPPGDDNYTGTRYPFSVVQASTAGPVGAKAPTASSSAVTESVSAKSPKSSK